jgi:hypothetical protein
MTPSRRLLWVMAAGLVDSLCLSIGWTLLLLRITDTKGLAGAGVCSAVALVGVALSAPAASWAARRLTGRALLRCAAGAEAVLRASLAVLVLTGAPLPAIAACVTLLNIAAYIGFAGMRAEVVACRLGPTALTWYGTIVTAVEAAGVSLAAVLPVDGPAGRLLLMGIVAWYVLGLIPQGLIARRSPVPRAAARVATDRWPVVSAPVVAGAALMFLGSAPALLAVPLTESLFGRSAVWMAAMAYTLGSLLAPAAASLVHRRGTVRPSLYLLCAGGGVAGWALAPTSVVLLCAAQLVAGICIALLEGLLDGAVSRRYPLQVTGALAMASAGRALGSAAGIAALPALVGSAGLPNTAGGAALLLLCGAVVASRWGRAVRRSRRAATVGAGPQADREAETVLPQALQESGAPVTWRDLVRRLNPPPNRGERDAWRDRELRLVAALQRLHRVGWLERSSVPSSAGEHC